MIQNNLSLWRSDFPTRKKEDHKYTHGHAVIFGAAKMTGATRLAAEACARMGAGLTTVLAPEGVGEIYRRTLAAHIIVRDRADGFETFLTDERLSSFLIGPGAGSDYVALRLDVETILNLNKPVVVDADGLNALESPKSLNEFCVITPHEGEFKKLFSNYKGERVKRAQEAAKLFGGIVVLKGAETVIASPSEIVINNTAPPFLATAGTGDVLAGMITGLLAQGMEPFKAACAAVWVHGAAAAAFGSGLVASDLPGQIPAILREFA